MRRSKGHRIEPWHHAPVTTDQPQEPADQPEDQLLGPAQIRDLAARLGVRPTKSWGQNFVIDKGTVRRIVRAAGVGPDDVVLEVGPGLGSLTLALLPRVRHVTAVEIDPVLAGQLPQTVETRAPQLADRLTVLQTDALRVSELPDPQPTALVANLPYNVAVPVVLHLLATVPTLQKVLVMVQLEVAERLAAGPGSKVYGVPSAKLAWYAAAKRVGTVPPKVFWPVPHVESGLVAIERREPPAGVREATFKVIDAAFAQRRKMLRSALSGMAGSSARASEAIEAAGIDPQVRGEMIDVAQFAQIAASLADGRW